MRDITLDVIEIEIEIDQDFIPVQQNQIQDLKWTWVMRKSKVSLNSKKGLGSRVFSKQFP